MKQKNPVIMQFFEWYLPSDAQHWQRLKDQAPHLASLGINQVWMPPAFKATGINDVGYGVYDLYDLGEFDQNGTIPTKYGTKEDYLQAIQALKDHGIKPIADIVLNHKANGDQKETFYVIQMDPMNRQQPLGEPFEIEGWTHFTFPGRQKQYSDFEWHWYHFTGTDFNAITGETGIYMIQGENKGWANNELVDDENGNFDYLMFTDIDFRHPEVIAHLKSWVQWYINETGVEGFRLDAIKHIDAIFMKNFIHDLRDQHPHFYAFGEFWQSDLEKKFNYLEQIQFGFDLVDVGLHMNFFQAGQQNEHYDLSQILEHSLMKEFPDSAVTFVDNHDTQRGQALESAVADWFKMHAYAIILLMKLGQPIVFYGDYYGIEHEQFGQRSFAAELDQMLYLRHHYAYGEEEQYLDHPNCIGWTRLGNEEHPDPMAVIMSNSEDGFKRMFVGPMHAGREFSDEYGFVEERVVIDEEGYGEFKCLDRSVSVWIPVKD